MAAEYFSVQAPILTNGTAAHQTLVAALLQTPLTALFLYQKGFSPTFEIIAV